MLRVLKHLTFTSFLWGRYYYYYLTFTNEETGIESSGNLLNITQLVELQVRFEPRKMAPESTSFPIMLSFGTSRRQNLSWGAIHFLRPPRLLAGSLKARTRVINLLSPKTPSMDLSTNKCYSNSCWLILYLLYFLFGCLSPVSIFNSSFSCTCCPFS